MSTISVLIVENNSGKQRIVKFLVVYNNLYLLSLSIEFTVIQFKVTIYWYVVLLGFWRTKKVKKLQHKLTDPTVRNKISNFNVSTMNIKFLPGPLFALWLVHHHSEREKTQHLNLQQRNGHFQAITGINLTITSRLLISNKVDSIILQ